MWLLFVDKLIWNAGREYETRNFKFEDVNYEISNRLSQVHIVNLLQCGWYGFALDINVHHLVLTHEQSDAHCIPKVKFFDSLVTSVYKRQCWQICGWVAGKYNNSTAVFTWMVVCVFVCCSWLKTMEASPSIFKYHALVHHLLLLPSSYGQRLLLKKWHCRIFLRSHLPSSMWPTLPDFYLRSFHQVLTDFLNSAGYYN